MKNAKPQIWSNDNAAIVKFLASSIEFEDDIAYNWHEFSSHTNSVSYPVTENPILLGQTFQLLERKLIL